jgi:uncharacterized repeat protein (TIGR02543 family)
MKNIKRKNNLLLALMLCCSFTLLSGAACNDDPVQQVTVTFDYEYGSMADVTQNVIVGDIAQEPAMPKRDGYDFLGWFEKNTDGSWKEQEFDFLGTTLNQNLVLYARWAESSKDMPKAPETLLWDFEDGILTVSSEPGTEFSFNDGAYSFENTYACGYSARVKISARKAETNNTAPSESLDTYVTTIPNADAFAFVSEQANQISVSVEGGELYEYKFEGSDEWVKGNSFTDLPNVLNQTVEIRVGADGLYKPSGSITANIQVRLGDGDEIAGTWAPCTSGLGIRYSATAEVEGACVLSGEFTDVSGNTLAAAEVSSGMENISFRGKDMIVGFRFGSVGEEGLLSSFMQKANAMVFVLR